MSLTQFTAGNTALSSDVTDRRFFPVNPNNGAPVASNGPMHTIGQRLALALVVRGLTASQLSERLSIKLDVIYAILLAPHTTWDDLCFFDLTYLCLADIFSEFEDYLAINSVWLRYGTGSMDDSEELEITMLPAPAAPEPLLCIHCAHFPPFHTGPFNCGHAAMRKKSLVDGNVISMSCEVARMPGQPCGPNAILFVKKCDL